jgi:hypothetical protein
MHTDAILAVCAILTLVGGVGLALIQVGAHARTLTLLEDAIERIEREKQIDADRIQAAYQREIDGIHRELSDLRGQAAILRRPR